MLQSNPSLALPPTARRLREKEMEKDLKEFLKQGCLFFFPFTAELNGFQAKGLDTFSGLIIAL